RHALSLGIDRDQLNEAFWLGVGTAGSIAPAPDTLYSPGPEWNKKYATLDLKQANELLDKVGLTKKDGDGYRLRTDGKGRLRLELVTVGGQFVPYTPVGEMIKQQWKKIGTDLDVKELEGNRVKNAKEIWRIAVEQMWSIGTVGQSPAVMGVRIVKNNMGNVPDRQVNAQHARTPHSSMPITFYFK